MAPADLLRPHPCGRLFQHRDKLFLGNPLLAHGAVLRDVQSIRRKSPWVDGQILRGQVTGIVYGAKLIEKKIKDDVSWEGLLQEIID